MEHPPTPFTRGIWIDAFFATLNNSSDPSLSLRMTIGRVVKKKPQFPHFASSKRWMNSRPRSVHTR